MKGLITEIRLMKHSIFISSFCCCSRYAGKEKKDLVLVHVHTCLGDSILRECPSLAQEDQRAVGLGCHEDHIYLDLRPMEEGREFEFVKVWGSGSSYYGHVLLLQISLFTGMCVCVCGGGGWI